MHSLTNPLEWEQAMGPEGALEALKEAQSGEESAKKAITTGALLAEEFRIKILIITEVELD